LNLKINKLQDYIKKKEENNSVTVKNIKLKLNDSHKKIEDLQDKIKELYNNNKILMNINEINEKINSSLLKSTIKSERKPIFDLDTINKNEKRENFMNINMNMDMNNTISNNNYSNSIDVNNNEIAFYKRSKSYNDDKRRNRSFSFSATNYVKDRIDKFDKDQLYKSKYNYFII
jgi:hypothetical protein